MVHNNNNNNNATFRPTKRRSFLCTLTSSIGFVAGLCIVHPVKAFVPIQQTLSYSALGTATTPPSSSSSAMSVSSLSTTLLTEEESTTSSSSLPVTNPVVAYKTIALPLAGYGINIPVSCWYPVDDNVASTSTSSSQRTGRTNDATGTITTTARYSYKISVRRIGELIARWDFIPNFVTKKFSFTPGSSSSSSSSGRTLSTTTTTTTTSFVDGSNIDIPKGRRVVVLAHGFLGSPLDLSHIAEDLSSRGFVCVSPEYPESLEASYPRLDGLDRKVITDRLLQYVDGTMDPLSYSAIGHSMGCGTVLQMGDDTWDRVLMGIGRAPGLPGSPIDTTSRFPLPSVGGRLLFVSSTNDGAVKFGTGGAGITIPTGYTILTESDITSYNKATTTTTTTMTVVPDRAALVFDRTDGPNHISFLAENVNEAMISFLAPLLPVASAFNIPVLDFDKYVTSRDSVSTGAILKPLIADFLSQRSR